nr:zinc finger, CCHC-type [Tanacetum cinerariifolium]
DAIFDENRFYSVLRPSLRILNETEDTCGSVVPEEVIEEDDPKTFDEAMKSQNVAFLKEEINDEMDSLMGNNTWVLADLSPANTEDNLSTSGWVFLVNGGTISKASKKQTCITGSKMESEFLALAAAG